MKKEQESVKVKVKICALYAGLSFHEQSDAFQKIPYGYRKIVISTNLAESSLTIPNIRFVVDSCFQKSQVYLSPGINYMNIIPCSKGFLKSLYFIRIF